MARIKTSAILDDIRGTLGGAVFSIWKEGVQVVRKKAAIICNPRSGDQQLLRSFLGYLSAQWMDFLGDENRALWEAYALSLRPVGDQDQGGGALNVIPHNRGIMSGFNAFMMIHLRLVAVGLFATKQTGNIAINPPVTPIPELVDTLTVQVVPDVGFTLDWLNNTPAPAGAILRVWAESYNTGMHKQLLSYAPVTALTLDCNEGKFAQGKENLFENHLGLYRLQCDVIDTHGQLSVPSEVFEPELTAAP